MRRMILVTVLLLCLLAACGETQTAGSQPAPEPLALTDSHESYPYDCESPWPNFLVTELGDYYIANELIMFCPKGADEFYPLCGKPNCAHNGPDCGAWTEFGIGLGFYRNRLYTTENSEYTGSSRRVTSRSLNGEDKRVEFEVEMKDLYYYVFHNHYMLCECEPDVNAPIEEQLARLVIYDLSDGSTREPFQGWFQPGNRLEQPLVPIGDQIFVPEDVLGRDGEIAETRLLQMDMNTGEVRELFSLDNACWWYKDGDKLVYISLGKSRNEYDLTTGETEGFPLDVPEAVLEQKDGYGYRLQGPLRNDRQDMTLWFLDQDRRPIGTLELTGGMRMMYADGERYYFGDYRERVVTAYLDKSRIGSGTLELTVMGSENP